MSEASQELSELNLLEDFKKTQAVADASRWKVEKPASLEVWAQMNPLSAPNELFQARLHWHVYPDEPPSLRFRDPATGRLDLCSAWPRVRGFRPESFDACVNWTSEGFSLHPEWKSDPRLRWDPSGNVLLKVLRILQDELDHHFDGRQK